MVMITLYDYIAAYILVKETTTVENSATTGQAANKKGYI